MDNPIASEQQPPAHVFFLPNLISSGEHGSVCDEMVHVAGSESHLLLEKLC